MTDVSVRPHPRSALFALVLALATALLVLAGHPPLWPWWDVLLALGIAGIVASMLRAALAPAVYGRFGSIELPEGVTVEATPGRDAGYRSAGHQSRPAQLTVTMRSPRHRHAMLAGGTCVFLLAFYGMLLHLARDPGHGATLALVIGLVPAVLWATFALAGARARRIEIDAERRVVRVAGGATTLLPPGARLTALRVYEDKAFRDELILEHRESAHRLLRHSLADHAQLVAIAQVIAEAVGALEVVVSDES